MNTYSKKHYLKNNIGIYVNKPEPHSELNEHLHEFVEIVYITGGSGIHSINGVQYNVCRGSLLFINYRETHSFKTDTSMSFYNILLDPEWLSDKIIAPENAFELLALSAFSEFQSSINTAHPLVQFYGSERTKFERLICDIEEEQEKHELGFEEILKAYTQILLTMIFRKMSKKIATDGKFRSDIELLDYIRKHCGEKLSLEQLARNSFYNPSYFSRMFKSHYGMTLTDFINKCRLEKGLELLKNSNLSIQEIVDKIGFDSRSAFYKLVKENTGYSPKEYRDVKKQNINT